MKDLLRILIAPLVWLASFSAVYGLQGLICEHGITGAVLGLLSLPRALMATAWMLAVLLQIILLRVLYARRLGSTSRFVTRVSRGTAWVGLVASVWTLLPTVTTTYCL